MSSTTRTNHQYKEIVQRSRSRSNQTKTFEHANKLSSQHPLPSPPPDKQSSSFRKARARNLSDSEILLPRKLARTENARRQPSLTIRNDDHHVIRTKAATTPTLRYTKPYQRSKCLEHMSAFNCNADCLKGEPLTSAMTPPAAPRPPRLPTPDLSDVDEDAFWSCCGPSKSSKCSTRCYDKTDDSNDEIGLWDHMDEQLTKAMTWQKKGRQLARVNSFK